MHRHVAVVLVLASTFFGAELARAGLTIVIGPQPPAAAGPSTAAKLGEGIVELVLEDIILPVNQSFVPSLSRNHGPQRTGQLFAVNVTARTTSGGPLEAYLASLADEDFRAGGPTFDAWRLADIVPGQLNPNVTGFLLGGERVFIGANVPTGTESFHPWLHALALPRSDGSPTLRTSLDLAPGLAGSAEVTDIQFATLPTSDTANGSSTYFLVAERGIGDCHTIKFGKADYDDDSQIFNSNFYQNTLSEFEECHTRAARLRSMSPERARFEDALLTFMGVRLKDTPAAPESVGLYQIRDQGTSAVLDDSFGGDGQVKIKHASGLNMRFWDLANQGEKLYVSIGLEGPQAGAYQPIIVRLNKDGTLDTGFGNNGIVTIPATGLSSNPRTISTDVRGNVVVTGETYTANSVRPFTFFLTPSPTQNAAKSFASQYVEYAFPGRLNSTFFTHDHAPDGTITFGGATFGNYPDVATMRPFVGRVAGPPGTIRAIEYFHAGLGHYAVISIPAEIQALDSGAIPGWSRTGFWFNVHAPEAPGTLGVDRFFSEAFAPKSSHFYTNNATEFGILQAGQVWKHEGRTFYAHWPSFANRCPPTMRPVKRIYNNGVTGAPNHRYADDATTIAGAIASGGVIESGAVDGSFFCTE